MIPPAPHTGAAVNPITVSQAEHTAKLVSSKREHTSKASTRREQLTGGPSLLITLAKGTKGTALHLLLLLFGNKSLWIIYSCTILLTKSLLPTLVPTCGLQFPE